MDWSPAESSESARNNDTAESDAAVKSLADMMGAILITETAETATSRDSDEVARDVILRADGPRNVVPVGEAAEIAERFLVELAAAATDDNDNSNSNDTTLTLDLSCRAWKLESLQQLQPVFDAILAKVTTLKLEDITASLLTRDGLESLKYLADKFASAPHLSIVNLDKTAIGTRGIEVLKKLIRNRTICHLSMNVCGLAEEDGGSLHEILGNDGNSASGKLQSLKLDENRMGASGAVQIGALLAKLPQLEEFSYAGNRPGKAGSRAVAEGLANGGSHFVLLDLTECTFVDGIDEDTDDDEGIPDRFRGENGFLRQLCNCLLTAARSLEVLKLSDCGLGCEGLQRVLEALDNACNLKLLELSANGELGLEGGQLLCRFFRRSQAAASLKYLGVGMNELGSHGVKALVLGAAAHCHRLGTLNLEANELTLNFNLKANKVADEGLQALIDHPIDSLQNLMLEGNEDWTVETTVSLQQVYPNVTVDEDLEDGGWSGGEEEEHAGKEKEKEPTMDIWAAPAAAPPTPDTKPDAAAATALGTKMPSTVPSNTNQAEILPNSFQDTKHAAALGTKMREQATVSDFISPSDQELMVHNEKKITIDKTTRPMVNDGSTFVRTIGTPNLQGRYGVEQIHIFVSARSMETWPSPAFLVKLLNRIGQLKQEKALNVPKIFLRGAGFYYITLENIKLRHDVVWWLASAMLEAKNQFPLEAENQFPLVITLREFKDAAGQKFQEAYNHFSALMKVAAQKAAATLLDTFGPVIAGNHIKSALESNILPFDYRATDKNIKQLCDHMVKGVDEVLATTNCTTESTAAFIPGTNDTNVAAPAMLPVGLPQAAPTAAHTPAAATKMDDTNATAPAAISLGLPQAVPTAAAAKKTESAAAPAATDEDDTNAAAPAMLSFGLSPQAARTRFDFSSNLEGGKASPKSDVPSAATSPTIETNPSDASVTSPGEHSVVSMAHSFMSVMSADSTDTVEIQTKIVALKKDLAEAEKRMEKKQRKKALKLAVASFSPTKKEAEFLEKAEKRKTGKPEKAPSLLGNFYRVKDGNCELARENEEGDIFCRVYDLLLSGEIEEQVSIAMKEKLSEESFRPFTNKEHFTQVVHDLFSFDNLDLNVKDYLKIKPHPNAKDCWTQLVEANKAKYHEYLFERSLEASTSRTTATATSSSTTSPEAHATDANSTPDAAKLAAVTEELVATKAKLAAEKESKETHSQVAMNLADKFADKLAAVNTENIAASKETTSMHLAAQKDMQEKYLKSQKEERAEERAASEKQLGTFTAASEKQLGTFTDTLLQITSDNNATRVQEAGMFTNALGEQRNQFFDALATKSYDQQSLTLQLLQRGVPANQEGAVTAPAERTRRSNTTPSTRRKPAPPFTRRKPAPPIPQESKPLLVVGELVESGVYEICHKSSNEVLYRATLNTEDGTFDVVSTEGLQQFKAGQILTGAPCKHCLNDRALCTRRCRGKYL